MATLTTAKTRLGVTGPAKNYSRPFAAKTESDVVETVGKQVLFLNTTGALINNF